MLDAGAGHQRYRPFFDEALYLAQEHPISGVQTKNLLLYDILCDVKTIPLRDDCVDVVLSTSSLEHMRYPEPFFKESHRVLAAGGSLRINVPFVYPEHEVPFDFQRPTRYGLLRWYEDAGFERVSVLPTSSSASTALSFLKEAMREERVRAARVPRDTAAARIIERVTTSYTVRRLLERLTTPYSALLSWVFDHGPSSDTAFPVGWVSVGYKNGTHRTRSRAWSSAAEFLAENAMNGAVLSDNVLRYDG